MAEPNELNVSGATPPNNADWEKLNALLEDLPPGIPILPPEDAGNFEKYTHRPPRAYAPGDGWKNCAHALEKYDAELCKGYREEIDTLLVFAGLFSAVVTAFTIESYQWLQADQNDAIVVLLTQIAQSVSPNNTASSLVSATAGLPGSVSVRVNIYWFLALSLSLSAALVAILCKQWVREFERNPGLTPKRFVAIHQMKLEGLEQWRVGAIISMLPLLLQLALALFALGVLELLWQLHSAVAGIVCVPTGVAFVFYTATTLIPALQLPHSMSFDRFSFFEKFSECPYKSPQAMLAYSAYEFHSWMRSTVASWTSYLVYLFSLAHYRLAIGSRPQRNLPRPIFERNFRLNLYAPSWRHVSGMNLHYDVKDPKPLAIYRSLSWISANLDDGDMREWIWHTLWETAISQDTELGYTEDIRKRGFCCVLYGASDLPQSGIRALALSYLLRTHVPAVFVFEAHIQNLSTMDAPSAVHLILHLYLNHRPYLIDAELAVTLLREASVFGRTHVHEPIGGFLVILARFSNRTSDSALCTLFLRCSLLLFHRWLGTQHAPYELATVETTREMAWVQLYGLLADPEDYGTQPERLRRLPGVQDLARLLSVIGYAQFHDNLAAIAPELSFDTAEGMCLVVRELQDIARRGVQCQGALSAPSSPSNENSPTALAMPSMAQPPAIWMEEEEASHTGSGAVSQAQLLTSLSSRHSHPEDSGCQNGVSRGTPGPSSTLDSPALHAVVIHEASSERSQSPSGEDIVYLQTDFQERHGTATRDDGDIYSRLSEVAGTRAAATTGGEARGKPSLHAAHVQARSSADARPMSADGRVAPLERSGETSAGNAETGWGLFTVPVHALSGACAPTLPEHEAAVSAVPKNTGRGAEAIAGDDGMDGGQADETEGAFGGESDLDGGVGCTDT